jgi:hypothetical protein
MSRPKSVACSPRFLVGSDRHTDNRTTGEPGLDDPGQRLDVASFRSYNISARLVARTLYEEDL